MSLLPLLEGKADFALIKTSPVLDIEKAIGQLGHVASVHVVQWRGDCKEVLYLLDFRRTIPHDQVQIVGVEIDDHGVPFHIFDHCIEDEKNADPNYAMPAKYIYEPGPAFMKAGGFKSLATRYGLSKLHPNTHLYTCDRIIQGFPGKVYRLNDVISPKGKLKGIKKAELVLRNFPGRVEALRAKLKVKEGGDVRIFAVTLCNDEKKLLICQKF